ncbi:hypothetical protein E1265_27060 [Streptomyces sp. 8K308]|uniref:hypothetical protein n=1 Tax=Streptomyces sp. 8K308 TaxID=2530388 RepID=UPI001047D6F7|nr:hypothetical protein [Streptomyces sp. 8K308]TDC15227.1 hypothetical protein E1265_27060 [Streptomyces sp. 8K308]
MPSGSRRREAERFPYEDIRDAMAEILEKGHGITTSRYHGRPFRMACHLIHQDNLERRKPRGKLPRCHPNFGKSERDFEGGPAKCELARDMPRSGGVGVDHEDTWWQGDRMVAYVWYPYEVPLRELGKADERLERHGLGLTLHTGWGAHYYGNTPAIAVTPTWFQMPGHPRTEDLIRAARRRPGRGEW